MKQFRNASSRALAQGSKFGGEQMSKSSVTEEQQSNMIKDPDDWKTGDEEMTGAQRSYLQTLADEAGEEVDPNLTKAEASKRIEELQQKTGRGV